MQIFDYPNNDARQILALGPESNGNFSFFHKNKLYFSKDFGDLLEDANFRKFKNELNKFLKKEVIRPDIILTDLHPLYKTTQLGQDLAKKYKAEYIQIQHHIAHIFSQIGNEILKTKNYKPKTIFGLALDGTGYGTDEKIWGGEVFKITNPKSQILNKFKIQRVGHLENQTMIGGDLSIQEPARILISILNKFLSKEYIYKQVKQYYPSQEFEVLYNQLQQNFNCVETSSTGRVLDAISVLLGFAENKRNYKHEATFELEANSSKPYTNLKPKIEIDSSEQIKNSKLEFDSKFEIRNSKFILNTTFLFEYLIKNLHKDKSRLAATAQLYIAQGLHEIVTSYELRVTKCYIAGGIANNKIISDYFESKKIRTNKKVPRGDAGLSFGQIIHYLLTNPRD